MFEPILEQIEDYKKIRWFSILTWVPIKILLAYVVIVNFDYGLYIVLGYILFALEGQSGIQFINAQEANYHLGRQDENYKKLQNKLSKIRKKLDKVERQINEKS